MLGDDSALPHAAQVCIYFRPKVQTAHGGPYITSGAQATRSWGVIKGSQSPCVAVCEGGESNFPVVLCSGFLRLAYFHLPLHFGDYAEGRAFLTRPVCGASHPQYLVFGCGARMLVIHLLYAGGARIPVTRPVRGSRPPHLWHAGSRSGTHYLLLLPPQFLGMNRLKDFEGIRCLAFLGIGGRRFAKCKATDVTSVSGMAAPHRLAI